MPVCAHSLSLPFGCWVVIFPFPCFYRESLWTFLSDKMVVPLFHFYRESQWAFLSAFPTQWYLPTTTVTSFPMTSSTTAEEVSVYNAPWFPEVPPALGTVSFPAVPPRAFLEMLSASLRRGPRVWERLLLPGSTVPRCGSLATELIVLVGTDGVPVGLANPSEVAGATHALETLLMNRGLGAKPAQRMVVAALQHVRSVNAGTLRLCRAVISSGSPTAPVLTLRIALKPIWHVQVNPDTDTVWFHRGHANLLQVHPAGKVALLWDPGITAPSVQFVDVLVRELVLGPHSAPGYTLVYGGAAADGDLPTDATLDGWCTLWCGIVGFLGLQTRVTSTEDLHRIVLNVASHRTSVFGAFIRYAWNRLARGGADWM